MSRNHSLKSDRRTFLRTSFAAVLAHSFSISSLATANSGFFQRNGLPIGLQLYTVGDATTNDLDGTFSKVARIGFKTVELAGFYDREPSALRAAADRVGLRLTSIHIGTGGSKLALDGDIAALAASVHALGATTVVLPIPLLRVEADKMVPPTVDDWNRTAAFLNEKGEALRREGLRLGYHNHNVEFAPISDTTGFDIIVRGTDPSLVTFEMDVGWVCTAGLDPVDLLGRYPGRFRLMHVKDIAPSTRKNFAFSIVATEVGRGIVDWRRIVPAARKAGVQQYFVEQDPPFDKDRFQSIADSFTFLSSMT